MNTLKTTTDLVKSILINDKKARNNDNYLYYQICLVIGKQKGLDIDSMSITRFFLHLSEYGFPAFETVRRSRQKLQATYPELAANSNVKTQRKQNEESFREYARRRMV